MSARPDRYELQYESVREVARYRSRHPEDPHLEFAEPQDTWVTETWDELEVCQRRAPVLAKQHGSTVLIFERIGICDVTPPGDPPGLLWDWDDLKLVDEINPPEGQGS